MAWRHVVSLLRETGNLEKTDPTLVEAYALNVAMMRQASAELSHGVTVENSHGTTVAHPACAILNAATMRIKAIVNDLGLCPSTSKFANAPDATQADKWSDLLSVN